MVKVIFKKNGIYYAKGDAVEVEKIQEEVDGVLRTRYKCIFELCGKTFDKTSHVCRHLHLVNHLIPELSDAHEDYLKIDNYENTGIRYHRKLQFVYCCYSLTVIPKSQIKLHECNVCKTFLRSFESTLDIAEDVQYIMKRAFIPKYDDAKGLTLLTGLHFPSEMRYYCSYCLSTGVVYTCSLSSLPKHPKHTPFDQWEKAECQMFNYSGEKISYYPVRSSITDNVTSSELDDSDVDDTLPKISTVTLARDFADFKKGRKFEYINTGRSSVCPLCGVKRGTLSMSYHVSKKCKGRKINAKEVFIPDGYDRLDGYDNNFIGVSKRYGVAICFNTFEIIPKGQLKEHICECCLDLAGFKSNHQFICETPMAVLRDNVFIVGGMAQYPLLTNGLIGLPVENRLVCKRCMVNESVVRSYSISEELFHEHEEYSSFLCQWYLVGNVKHYYPVKELKGKKPRKRDHSHMMIDDDIAVAANQKPGSTQQKKPKSPIIASTLYTAVADAVLKCSGSYFRNKQQQEILEHVCNTTESTFCELPTDWDRNLLFMVPGMVDNGITLVVEPCSLSITNLVQKCQDVKIPAIHGFMCNEDTKISFCTISDLKNARCLIFSGRVKRIIFDEAHVFITSRKRTTNFNGAISLISELSNHTPCLFMSATLPPASMACFLKIIAHRQNLMEFKVDNTSRKSIEYIVSNVKKEKEEDNLLQWVNDFKNAVRENPDSRCIVYCNLNNECEQLKQLFDSQRLVKSQVFNAETIDQTTAIKEWEGGLFPVMIATSVFAAMVDYHRVSHVIHYGARSLIDYVQGSGMAGGDDKPAKAIAIGPGKAYRRVYEFNDVFSTAIQNDESLIKVYGATRECRRLFISRCIDRKPDSCTSRQDFVYCDNCRAKYKRQPVSTPIVISSNIRRTIKTKAVEVDQMANDAVTYWISVLFQNDRWKNVYLEGEEMEFSFSLTNAVRKQWKESRICCECGLNLSQEWVLLRHLDPVLFSKGFCPLHNMAKYGSAKLMKAYLEDQDSATVRQLKMLGLAKTAEEWKSLYICKREMHSNIPGLALGFSYLREMLSRGQIKVLPGNRKILEVKKKGTEA